MPRLAANVNWLYQEHPFLERFAAAARDGFRGVEILAPYEHSAAEIRARADDLALEVVLVNTPAGEAARGERGLASLPGREADFHASIGRALEYALALGNKRLHVMAGLIGPGEDRERHRDAYRRNLAYAAAEARALGITVLIEPINTRDIPGYFLNRQDEAHGICREVGADNLRVQMDFYHCQVVEGDLATKLRRYFANVAHVQVAGVPERHEPDRGEVSYPYLFALLDELGYDGWVGCEYRPRARTSEGLGWAREWLTRG